MGQASRLLHPRMNSRNSAGSWMPSLAQSSTTTDACAPWTPRARAFQYHPYELAPTASELTRWLNDTADLVTVLQSRADSRRHAESPAPG